MQPAGFYAGELRRRGPDAHPGLYVIQFLCVNTARFMAGLLLKRVVKVTDGNMLAQLVKMEGFFLSLLSPRLEKKKNRFTAVNWQCGGSV